MKKNLVLYLLICLLSVTGLGSYAGTFTAGEILKSYGAIAGDQYGNLNEGKSLTRAEMAVIMASLNGKNSEVKNFKLKSTFTDVNATEWYAPYIAYAQAMGWSNGIGDNHYGPNNRVTTQEVAAFLLNILGKKYTYETAIIDAQKQGIFNGLESSGNITRGNLFRAMLDALKVVPEGQNKNLGAILGYTEEVKLPSIAQSVQSVKLHTPKSIQVQFSKPVADKSTIAALIKFQTKDMTLKMSWNENSTVMTLTNDLSLPYGVYDIAIMDGNTKLYDQTLTVEGQKVSRIEINSSTLSVVTQGINEMGFITYSVYDQFGNDITKDARTSNITGVAAPYTAQCSNGVLTLKTSSATLSLLKDKSLKVSVVDPSTGVSDTKTLDINLQGSALSDITFNTSSASILNSATTPVYIPYKATDLMGNATESFDMISFGLLDMNYTGMTDNTIDLVVSGNPAGVKAEIVRSDEDQNKAVIKITATNAPITADTTVTLIMSTKTGKTSTINLRVIK